MPTQTLFIRVRGWDKYQHYKDRNPPWIKLHQELMTSLTWTLADNQSRVLAIAIMLLASRTGNLIPANHDYIKRVAYLHELPDFSQLVRLEFIEIIDDKGKVVRDASTTLASARPETETEEETKTEKKKPSARSAPGGPPTKPASTKSTDHPEASKHHQVRELIKAQYLRHNEAACPWDGGEAGQLDKLLKATPDWHIGLYQRCLENLYRSEGFPKGMRPREFLPWLPKSLNAPLDRFKNEAGAAHGSNSKNADRDARNREAITLGSQSQGHRANAVPDGPAVQPGDHARTHGPVAGSPARADPKPGT